MISETPAQAESAAPEAAPAERSAAERDESATPTPSTSTAALPSTNELNAELAQLKVSLGQVGSSFSALGTSLWGQMRKQGESALAASRRELAELNKNAQKEISELNEFAAKTQKDVMPLYARAREELGKLSEQAKEQATKLSEQARATAAAGQAASVGSPTGEGPREGEAAQSDAPDVGFFGDIVSHPDIPRDSSSTSPSLLSSPGTASAFFSRIQTQLSANPNLRNLQHQLADSGKIAEGYFKQAADYLDHAVRIVPPTEEQARSRSPASVAAGRKEALLAKLRSSAAMVLLVDPAQPPAEGSSVPDTREAFALFLQSIEDEHGGLESEAWTKKINAELALPEPDGPALKSAFDATVPSKLPAEAFWTRYFFRVHQIEEDEAKRKLVLQGAQTADEDFSWDNEEEDESATTKAETSTTTASLAPKIIKTAPSASSTEEKSPKDDKAVTSPRDSSEEGTMSSYDVVSRNASGSEAGHAKTVTDDGDESDWE